MLKSLNLKQVLFLDIETVPQTESFKELHGKTKELWLKKSEYFRKEGDSDENVYQRAGIYAEFGKIVCISVGMLNTTSNEEYGFKLKSFAGTDEALLLEEFTQLILKMEAQNPVILCAHNGKEFDFPYISRRLLINGIELPYTFDNAGKKPWEIQHIDTLELWKFGDYKHYTSLDLLTHVFDIPSPKEDIDGSMVADVFYNKKDLNKIITYCENDVVAVVQLLMRYQLKPLIKTENIIRTKTS